MTFNNSYLVRMSQNHEKYVFLDLILHTLYLIYFILILMNCTQVKIIKNTISYCGDESWKNGPPKNGPRKKWSPGKMVPGKNGPREKWSPGKMVSEKNGSREKWSPENGSPGKMVPGKNGPREKWSPGKMVSEKNGSREKWSPEN